MAKVQPRDISPLLQKLRNFLLGRKHNTALRFEDVVASRSPPPPVIPDGPCHNINANYYCTRDVRREVKPPDVVSPLSAVLEPGVTAVDAKPAGAQQLPRPGKVFHWD